MKTGSDDKKNRTQEGRLRGAERSGPSGLLLAGLGKARTNYNHLSLPFKAGLWFTVCSFLQRSVTMITTPVFTRLLSQSEYGIISTFQSWKTLLECVLTFCFASCAMQLYVRSKEKGRVLSALCSMELLVMSVWTVIFFIFRRQLSSMLGLSEKLVCALIVLILASQITELWMGYKRYLYEYRVLVAVTLLLTVVSSFYALFCVIVVAPTAEMRLIPQAVVSALVGAVIYHSVIRNNRVFCDKEIWRMAAVTGIPYIFANLSHFILASSDQLMISRMCGTQDVAVYSIAYSVSGLTGIVTSAISASFTPYSYQMIKAGEFERLAKRNGQVAAVVAGMLMCIIFAGHEIVLVFAGKQYLESVDLIFPAGLGIYYNYIVTIFARLQQYQLKNVTLMLSAAGCAALNLVLNYIFIQIYGFRAAAYTTFISYFVFCLVHYVLCKRLMRRYYPGRKLIDMKQLALISALFMIVGALVSVLDQYKFYKYMAAVMIVCLVFHNRKQMIHMLRDFF